MFKVVAALCLLAFVVTINGVPNNGIPPALANYLNCVTRAVPETAGIIVQVSKVKTCAENCTQDVRAANCIHAVAADAALSQCVNNQLNGNEAGRPMVLAFLAMTNIQAGSNPCLKNCLTPILAQGPQLLNAVKKACDATRGDCKASWDEVSPQINGVFKSACACRDQFKAALANSADCAAFRGNAAPVAQPFPMPDLCRANQELSLCTFTDMMNRPQQQPHN